MPGDKYEILWNEVWERVRTYNNIDVDQVNAFFSRLVPQAFSEGFLMLTADNGFIKDWVEKKFLHLIKQALEEQYGVPFNVAIEVDSTATYTPTTPPITQEEKPSEPDIINTVQTPTQPLNQAISNHQYPEDTLVSDYSFDNFVVGPSNQLAYSMALAVAENPGQNQLNPLFLYGKSGLGKTHLLRAIQNYANHNYPQLKTIYVDTNELVNDYAEASRNNSYDAYNKRYYEADMILIDDVQYLQGREGTIGEVFKLFNTMKDHGKQVIFAADRAPKHIDLDERTKSRFNSGGTCDIQPPEIETKLGIIRNYIEECKQKGELQFDINNEIQSYVAHNSSSNIRELKSAINKIILYGRSFEKSAITVEEVSHILRDHFSGGAMKIINVEDIQKAVEQYFSISHADLVGKKRSAHISHARHVALYLCRTMIDIPFATIGKEFNRDHTSVMYGVTQIEEKMRESREQNEELEIIQQMITE